MKIIRTDSGAAIVPENQADSESIAGLFEGDMSDKDRLKAFGQALVDLAGLAEVPELPFPADDGDQGTLDLDGGCRVDGDHLPEQKGGCPRCTTCTCP